MSEELPVMIEDGNGEGSDTVVFPSGNPLTISETYDITASEESQFIVVMGATGSGKTTLVTSLYQLFLNQCGCENCYFAGSKTLAAFEERSFYTRVKSNSTQPVTPRTPRGSLENVLHLRLARADQRHINLLLSDFSGEDFIACIANPDYAREAFKIVKSAKCILLLIDGKKLSSIRYRASEIQQAIQILKTFFNAGLISEQSEIIIAISKYDLVRESHDEILESIPKQIVEAFQKQIPELSRRIQMVCVAAMPENRELVTPYYGFNELLTYLLLHDSINLIPVVNEYTNSQFELWGMRHNNE